MDLQAEWIGCTSVSVSTISARSDPYLLEVSDGASDLVHSQRLLRVTHRPLWYDNVTILRRPVKSPQPPGRRRRPDPPRGKVRRMTGFLQVSNEVGDAATEFGASQLRRLPDTGIGAIAITIDPKLGSEAFEIRPGVDGTAILGGDSRGAMYGAFEAAEQLTLAGSVVATSRRPYLAVRGLKFNLPVSGSWYVAPDDLARSEWFWDLDYWKRFLDDAARNRYNAVTFWAAHPFAEMVHVPEYPEASTLDQSALEARITFFRALFRMAAERAIDTFLVTWNIHLPPALARHHGIPETGFDSPLVRDYMRRALVSCLTTYPMLTGLGTAAAEEMPGMGVRERLDWVRDTYLAALQEAGRTTPFILRDWGAAPDEASVMLEQAGYPGPVYLDIKYNGEHMYSSPRPHIVDTGWLKRGHRPFQLLPHLRNDDLVFFRWGDPAFVRATLEHVKDLGSIGFVEGSEIDIPGPDQQHTDAAQSHVTWSFKFEKHWFRYMLWGRLGYDRDEPDDRWIAHFTWRFGEGGPHVFEAIRNVSRIAPRMTAYHWSFMDGDWYPEGSIGSWNTSWELARPNYRRATHYHDVMAYIFNSTIDAEFASIPEYLAGSKATGPLDVARELAECSARAKTAIARARSGVERSIDEFECTAHDVEAYAALGRYFAAKLEGAVALAKFLFFGDESDRASAVSSLERALAAWRELVAITEAHYLPQTIFLVGHFHWKDFTSDVERDVAIARDAQPFRKESSYALEGMHPWLAHARELLGFVDGPAPDSSALRIRVEAESAEWMTPEWTVVDDAETASGQCLELRLDDGQVVDTPMSVAEEAHADGALMITHELSATYTVALPVDGRYDLSMRCRWSTHGGTLGIVVDEGNLSLEDGRRRHRVRSPAGTPVGTWIEQRWQTKLDLGAGRHFVRLYSRVPGLAIDCITLTHARADAARG